MLFSSNIFLFLFLPCVLAGYYLLPRRLRNLFLLCASLFFYAWGSHRFVLMMMLSIVFNYTLSLLMDRLKNQKIRNLLLFVTVLGNLSVLFVYKYLDFFITNVNALGFSFPLQHIALPLGISFFTFQAMSYSIDVYRGTVRVQKKLTNVALYVSFFPQLVAGPIVRYKTIEYQIEHRKETLEDFCEGVKRFIIGFAKKIILSNNMALVADTAFAMQDGQRSVVFAWMGILAYAFQLLFDFSGYSDMAIGLGKMFGFHFLENFDYPYISASVSEFWRRWHMSLGSWFRDYVYFPLGGSRVKSTGRLVFNLFVVWLLTGVWHGANWTFVFWGLLEFVFIAFEKFSGYPKRFRKTWQKELYRIITILCILSGYVLFRAADMESAVSYLKSMYGLTGNLFTDDSVLRFARQYQFYYLASFLCSVPFFRAVRNRLLSRKPTLEPVLEWLSLPVYLFLMMWSVSYIMMGSHNPFIYFNF